jgi:hypothetical protein
LKADLHLRLPDDISAIIKEMAEREMRTLPKQIEYLLRQALATEATVAAIRRPR